MPAFTSIFLALFAGYVATTLTLYILSWTLSPANARLPAFFARAFASAAALIACASYGFLAAIALRCVGYAGLSQWTTARSFKWSMWLSTGVWFDVVEGKEYLKGTRPAVFVGNHQAELDVLLLGAIFPPYCSVSAKRSLRWWPVLGQFMWASKTVFIDRGNSKNARAAFDSAAQHMCTEKQSVFIFPEGTRSYSLKPELLPFKKGAFHLAVQAQVPIVPVVAANYSDVLTLKGGWKNWHFRSGRIPVKVLRPIKTEGLKADSVDEISRWCRDDMLRTLEEMGRKEKIGNGPTQAFTSGADSGKKMSQMPL